jgi:hypothetical protein
MEYWESLNVVEFHFDRYNRFKSKTAQRNQYKCWCSSLERFELHLIDRLIRLVLLLFATILTTENTSLVDD